MTTQVVPPRPQPRDLARLRRGGQTFHKGLSLAPTIATSPPAEPELQCHPLALNRQILQPPVVPAVKRLRVLTAVRTPLISLADRRDQPATIDLLGTDDTHVGSEGPITHLFHIAKIVGNRRRSTRLHEEPHRSEMTPHPSACRIG
jgi:hypothetical protein